MAYPDHSHEQSPLGTSEETAVQSTPQSTLTFVSEHEGAVLAFIIILLALIGYFWREGQQAKKEGTKVVIDGLQASLNLQRETIDQTLDKLNVTIDKLERTVTDLAAELFCDLHNLDRRLSRLEGEHEALHSKDQK
jgi:hypothetical protein